MWKEGDSVIDEIFMEHFLGASNYILGAGDTAGNQADKGPAFLECHAGEGGRKQTHL